MHALKEFLRTSSDFDTVQSHAYIAAAGCDITTQIKRRCTFPIYAWCSFDERSVILIRARGRLLHICDHFIHHSAAFILSTQLQWIHFRQMIAPGCVQFMTPVRRQRFSYRITPNNETSRALQNFYKQPARFFHLPCSFSSVDTWCLRIKVQRQKSRPTFTQSNQGQRCSATLELLFIVFALGACTHSESKSLSRKFTARK